MVSWRQFWFIHRFFCLHSSSETSRFSLRFANTAIFYSLILLQIFFGPVLLHECIFWRKKIFPGVLAIRERRLHRAKWLIDRSVKTLICSLCSQITDVTLTKMKNFFFFCLLFIQPSLYFFFFLNRHIEIE